MLNGWWRVDAGPSTGQLGSGALGGVPRVRKRHSHDTQPQMVAVLIDTGRCTSPQFLHANEALHLQQSQQSAMQMRSVSAPITGLLLGPREVLPLAWVEKAGTVMVKCTMAAVSWGRSEPSGARIVLPQQAGFTYLPPVCGDFKAASAAMRTVLMPMVPQAGQGAQGRSHAVNYGVQSSGP